MQRAVPGSIPFFTYDYDIGLEKILKYIYFIIMIHFTLLQIHFSVYIPIFESNEVEGHKACFSVSVIRGFLRLQCVGLHNIKGRSVLLIRAPLLLDTFFQIFHFGIAVHILKSFSSGISW